MNFIRQISILFFAACVITVFCAVAAFSQATLISDKSDYPPGDTVLLSGAGFTPAEAITLEVMHSDGTFDNDSSEAHQPWQVTADDSGSFQTTWFVPTDQDELGASLKATADGQVSGLHAEAFFTDAVKKASACNPDPC